MIIIMHSMHRLIVIANTNENFTFNFFQLISILFASFRLALTHPVMTIIVEDGATTAVTTVTVITTLLMRSIDADLLS